MYTTTHCFPFSACEQCRFYCTCRNRRYHTSGEIFFWPTDILKLDKRQKESESSAHGVKLFLQNNSKMGKNSIAMPGVGQVNSCVVFLSFTNTRLFWCSNGAELACIVILPKTRVEY